MTSCPFFSTNTLRAASGEERIRPGLNDELGSIRPGDALAEQLTAPAVARLKQRIGQVDALLGGHPL
ncbi:MAG: hypothetical protein P8Z40_18085 [Chloroflexota bacterium]